MFRRVGKLLIELPMPKKQDPNAGAALQELLGGKYGEMSTLNNYMYQSFNFRIKSKLRAIYDIVASITAEEVGAYKPLMRGFEYMFDKLGCGPEDITHVSSSFRYDLMTAYDLGIKSKVWVNRGHEPANPYYEYTEIKDIGGLAGVFGIEEARQPA